MNTTSTNYFSISGIASGYAAFTSSGYIVAILTSWMLLWQLGRKRDGASATRKSGAYGKKMILLGKRLFLRKFNLTLRVDAVDAIPEAMVVAGATADGRMTVAFALSVFMLNAVNTMATAIDFLAVRPERSVHRLLLVFIFFSVGSLFLSVSESVFDGFIESVQTRRGVNYLLLLPIFGGILCGVLVVWIVLYAQTKWLKGDNASAVGAVSDSIVLVKQSIGKEQEVVDELAEMSCAEDSNDFNVEQRQQVIGLHQKRLDRLRKLERLQEALEVMNEVSVSSKLPITDDTQSVMDDAIVNEISTMNSNGRHLLSAESIVTPGGESLTKRALRLLLVYCFISAWTIFLVFVLTPLFAYMHTTYMDAFADGFSAGAFFSIISSTMIPRIQQDAYRSHWSSLMFKSVGMFAFVAGICTTFILALVPAPGQ